MSTLKENVSSQGSQVSNATTSSGGGIDYGEYGMVIITKFIEVLGAALILIATYFVIRWVRSYFTKTEAQHEQQRTALNLLEKITTGFIIVVGLTLALKTIGLDMSLLVSVGLLGLSYGLKDVIKNYIAGILIFLKSPFKIGDIVKIKKFVGRVEKMELQATSIKTFDNRDVTIYNSDIMKKSIENYSRYPMRRMEINVSLGYGSDFEKATRIFDMILQNETGVLKSPKYSIIFKKFNDNSIIFQLKFWVKMPCNMLAVRSKIALQIHQAFDENSIFAPYNKGFEMTENYTLNTDRQGRIKAFQEKTTIGVAVATPTMVTTATAVVTQTATGQQPAANGQPATQAAPVIEFIDADEPSIEDDL